MLSFDHCLNRMVFTVFADDGQEYFVRTLAVILAETQWKTAEINYLAIAQILQEARSSDVAATTFDHFDNKSSCDVPSNERIQVRPPARVAGERSDNLQRWAPTSP